MKQNNNGLLTTFSANLKKLCLERPVTRKHNTRFKEILKRRAMFGNQTVVLLTISGVLTNSGASNLFFVTGDPKR